MAFARFWSATTRLSSMVTDCRTFLSRATVVSAYRLILAREPESETTVLAWMQCPSIDRLIERFLESPEFSRMTPASQHLGLQRVLAGMIK